MSRVVNREFFKTELLAKLASRRTHNVEDGPEVELIRYFRLRPLGSQYPEIVWKVVKQFTSYELGECL